MRSFPLSFVGAALGVVVCVSSCAPPVETTAQRLGGDSELAALYTAIGDAHGVPPEIVATIAFVETRLRPQPFDEHGHGPNVAFDPWVIAAALRDEAARIEPASLEDWRQVVAAAGSWELANDVFDHLARGWRGRDADGDLLIVTARRAVAASYALGYDGAIWNPAHSSNYSNSSRTADDIEYVVIHTVQGSYNGAISWFKNSSSNVSSHYVVRSSDGEVTQMVDDQDVAWHDACFNSETIGIEHEGFVEDPDVWYTESMYMESAKLTAWIADEYGIPKDRDHILGHGEAPDCSSHTDPGSGWDWDHYMDLVGSAGVPQLGAAYIDRDHPQVMVSGEEAVVYVEFQNESTITWGLDETRLGTQMPADRQSAFFVDGNWLSPSRATGADHSNYGPGSVGRFSFVIRAPEVEAETDFVEHFQLVQEGVDWFGPIIEMPITVKPKGTTPGETDPKDDGTTTDDGEDPPGSGGCSVDSGAPVGGCAILLIGALLSGLCRRRRRRVR